MFRLIIGYTLIYTVFATIAASSPAVAAQKPQQVTAAQKQCLIAAGFWRARGIRTGLLTGKQAEAIAIAQTKQCLKSKGTKQAGFAPDPTTPPTTTIGSGTRRVG